MRIATALFKLDDEELARAAASEVAAELLVRIESEPEEELRGNLEGSAWACCRHDPLFPAGLRDCAEAPWAVFGRGDPALLASLEPQGTIAVIGGRKASTYGREVARELAHGLGEAGITVLGGLSFGVEACAHRGALDVGTTVAVLGCGPDVPYPSTHRSLWRRICERGLVLSELPPGCGAWRWSLAARSRIIAALAGMTIVVEATERSRSMLTADLAVEYGRDLGAMPGPVDSRLSVGPNHLLANGAVLVRDAQDALDALLGPGAGPAARGTRRLNYVQREVLAAVGEGATCEEVMSALRLSTEEAMVALATLEALGYLNGSLTGVYTPTDRSSGIEEEGA